MSLGRIAAVSQREGEEARALSTVPSFASTTAVPSWSVTDASRAEAFSIVDLDARHPKLSE